MTNKTTYLTAFLFSFFLAGCGDNSGTSSIADPSTTSGTNETESTNASNNKSTESSDLTQIYTTSMSFEDTKEGIEMAITDKGLIISGTMHISDMLNRTGKDVGVETPVFTHAEGIEFCSAIHSHKMAQAHPSNISMCPFTIVVYQKTADPDKSYVAYRNIKLMGDGKATEKEISDLMHDIVSEVLE